MNRRELVVGGGASALTLAVAGLAAHRAVDAQDATPSAGTGTPATAQDDKQTRYQAFVAALAANLGIADAGTVDTAIRTTLKQQVDAEYAAGNISANDATALKDAIDASDAPLGGFGKHGGRRGGTGGRHDGGLDDDGDGDDAQPGGAGGGGTTPSAGATPTATL